MTRAGAVAPQGTQSAARKGLSLSCGVCLPPGGQAGARPGSDAEARLGFPRSPSLEATQAGGHRGIFCLVLPLGYSGTDSPVLLSAIYVSPFMFATRNSHLQRGAHKEGPCSDFCGPHLHLFPM